MRPLTELSSSEVENLKLLTFDADAVTVEQGTGVSEIGDTTTVKIKKISPQLLEKINRLKKRFHVNFSSGRSLLYLADVYGPVLWENASIQGENGLFTLIDGQVIQHDKLTEDELELLNSIELEIRKIQPEVSNIRGFEPKQFMVTVHAHEYEKRVEDIVRRYDREEKLYLYWNGEAHDIFLKRFSKGTGLEWLAKHLNFDLSQTLAVGNDPNDQSMLEIAGVSVTTNPDRAKADFHTVGKLHLGGEELVDYIWTKILKRA